MFVKLYIAKIFLSYFAKGLVHKRFETTRKKGRKKRRKKGEMEGGRDEGRKERREGKGKEKEETVHPCAQFVLLLSLPLAGHM